MKGLPILGVHHSSIVKDMMAKLAVVAVRLLLLWSSQLGLCVSRSA